MGAAARYAAQEQAPVVADTLNYLGAAAAPAVRAAADAVRDGENRTARTCPSCAAANDADARFCDTCGTSLIRTCPSCQTGNDPDASYCDFCGGALA
jgi:hypothetical protein